MRWYAVAVGWWEGCPPFDLVDDLDDTRKNAYRRYYTQKKPLTLAALENDSPGI